MKFLELSDKAKDYARQKYFEPAYEWWDWAYERAKEDGKARGFYIHDIKFSGFWSQGDGASWTGTIVIPEWLELNKPTCAKAMFLREAMQQSLIDKQVSVTTTNSNYSHSKTMVLSTWDAWSLDMHADEELGGPGQFASATIADTYEAMEMQRYLADLIEEMTDSARYFADEIYADLQDEYEHMLSDEYIAEACEANQYKFNEKGEMLWATEAQ